MKRLLLLLLLSDIESIRYFLFNRARDRDRQTFVFNFEMKKRKKEKKKKKNWVPFLTPSTMRYISHL